MSAMPLHSVGQYSFSQRPETCILSAQHLSGFFFFLKKTAVALLVV